MEEKVRIRLAFEGRKLLSRSQRSQGLQCCWMLLRPDLHTISALSSFILSSFDIHRRCSDGLILTMDDFVLPPSETTGIFKDKDIIRVRRKDAKQRVKTADDANAIEDAHLEEKEPEIPQGNLLVINQSNVGHNGHEEEKNASCLLSENKDMTGPSHTTPSQKRKRKSSSELRISKNTGQKASQGCTGELPQTNATKKTPSRNARRKKEKRKRLRGLIAFRRKKDCSPGNQNHEVAPPCQTVQKSASSEDETVPVVVRPGHIRFQSLGKSADVELRSLQKQQDQARLPLEVKVNSKNQKEGPEKSYTKRLCDNNAEEGETVLLTDFESLFPLTRFPEIGDVVAYRLVDFSASYPEFSDFKVGQVSSFNLDSMKAILVPVPGYPISMDKASSSWKNISLYKEDGSLEIDFLSLVDVRFIKQNKPDATTTDAIMKACNNEVGQGSAWDAGFQRGSSQDKNAAATTSKTCSWNGNDTTTAATPSNKWDSLLLRGSSQNQKTPILLTDKTTKWQAASNGRFSANKNGTVMPTNGSKSSLTSETWPAGWNSNGAWSSIKSTANHDFDDKQTQGRDWDEIKRSRDKEAAVQPGGWPQWESREYLANTSWSFLLRGPPPRPPKKPRADSGNSRDAPCRNNRNRYKC